MKKVVKDIPKVELKSYVDMKSELDDFFASIIHELADNYMYDKVATKKAEFLSWLKANFLFTLVEPNTSYEITTEFEWECRKELLEYLCKFDMFLLQCLCEGAKEELHNYDFVLRKNMSKFNKEYDID